MSHPIIEMRGVHKAFTRKILKGMNMTVRKGETMVILGPSGTGKSVTLKHITGLVQPDQGDCFIDGESISFSSEKIRQRLRARMGVLFQSGALINWLSVYDNVALPLREHKLASGAELDRIVMERLKWLDLVHAKDNLPGDISGGMKKRAGIARALTTNPEILLYDEPTSGLDPVMSNVFNELILRLQKELSVTSIVVTHDMQSAYMIADRISFIYEGEVILCGTPAEIQAAPNPIIQQFINGRTKGPMILDHSEQNKKK
ncbi:MAG TPA: ABC transporter ATP-binding protein [Leptospiraceae bacterium]|nr:ABC transporter ATP-binding protein [Leptospiraceae bacterium]HMY65581.1 ABC transporter ATP-binding protein [Leptospiraceae bacterium]HMZ59653.1 ABC transporter ATP-binding protein [Leptospiraceae bacterium]HNF14920.1 ABC transporter ATP-binding protein [Leptospiraceae bacterium]HNI26625.1 ABC transporter ATP-binding protein [Leptospiraceae bacterium]